MDDVIALLQQAAQTYGVAYDHQTVPTADGGIATVNKRWRVHKLTDGPPTEFISEHTDKEEARQACWLKNREAMRECVQAAGFQIVPVEPTEAMKREGARSIGKTMGWENHNLRSSDCYRAMLKEAQAGAGKLFRQALTAAKQP